jgi:DNA-binding PadR family transcriptional regulator
MFRVRLLLKKRAKSKEQSFNRGDLKYVILDLIKGRSRHGYEIIQELEELSHGLYKPSPGAIYPVLQMLEDMGYASIAERDGKKFHSITNQGRQFLKERQAVTNEVKSKLKLMWSFKNSSKLEAALEDLQKIEETLLDRKLRSGDIDKLQQIQEVISQASQTISKILSKEIESDK